MPEIPSDDLIEEIHDRGDDTTHSMDESLDFYITIRDAAQFSVDALKDDIRRRDEG